LENDRSAPYAAPLPHQQEVGHGVRVRGRLGPKSMPLVVGTVRVAIGALSIGSTAVVRALERVAAEDDTERSDSGPRTGGRAAVTAVQSVADGNRRLLAGLPSYSWFEARRAGLARLIRDERARSEATATQFFAVLIPEIAEGLLNSLDLTEIVVDRVDVDRLVQEVDLEAVVQGVDLNAAASRIDLDAMIDRIDLVRIANYLMEELEIPEIIRESTSALAVESVEQLRVQGIRADRFVSHVLDRMVRRRDERDLEGPAVTQSGSTVHANGGT
jgi:hypothetical protein